jgi:hypothetical protein
VFGRLQPAELGRLQNTDSSKMLERMQIQLTTMQIQSFNSPRPDFFSSLQTPIHKHKSQPEAATQLPELNIRKSQKKEDPHAPKFKTSLPMGNMSPQKKFWDHS